MRAGPGASTTRPRFCRGALRRGSGSATRRSPGSRRLLRAPGPGDGSVRSRSRRTGTTFASIGPPACRTTGRFGGPSPEIRRSVQRAVLVSGQPDRDEKGGSCRRKGARPMAQLSSISELLGFLKPFLNVFRNHLLSRTAWRPNPYTVLSYELQRNFGVVEVGTRASTSTGVDLDLPSELCFPPRKIRLQLHRVDLVDCFRRRLIENCDDPEVNRSVAINVFESERMFRSDAKTVLAFTFEIQPCDGFDFILTAQRIFCVVTDPPPPFSEVEQLK